MTDDKNQTRVDVLIIGGGPAGLSAALALARHLHHVIVFDNKKFRNYSAQHMHNVLTWDHRPPQEFRNAAVADLKARYKTVKFSDKTIITLRQVEEGFEAVDEVGKLYAGRKVVLAHGRTDIFPNIEGYEECWGRSAFHCLFCHGFEERGGASAGVLALGVLTNPNMLLHIARMASQLARSITIYTHGDKELTATLQDFHQGKPILFDERRIVALRNVAESGVEVHFECLQCKAEAFLVHIPDTCISGDFHTQLGLEVEEQFGFPCIKTSKPFMETSVPGCFAVGDISSPISSVVGAMQAGTLCAGAVSPQLAQLTSF